MRDYRVRFYLYNDVFYFDKWIIGLLRRRQLASILKAFDDSEKNLIAIL